MEWYKDCLIQKLICIITSSLFINRISLTFHIHTCFCIMACYEHRISGGFLPSDKIWHFAKVIIVINVVISASPCLYSHSKGPAEASNFCCHAFQLIATRRRLRATLQ